MARKVVDRTIKWCTDTVSIDNRKRSGTGRLRRSPKFTKARKIWIRQNPCRAQRKFPSQMNGSTKKIPTSEDITSKFSNSIATPESLISVQTFVTDAIITGYTAHQKSELEGILTIMEEIVDRLRYLKHDTTKIDLILQRIRKHLQTFEQNLVGFRFSTASEEIDTLEELAMNMRLDIFYLSTASLLSTLESNVQKSQNLKHKFHVKSMVTGGTSLLIWATYGLVPITIPVGLVAWYYWFKYKMSYYDVADHIKQINRLIEKLHIYEMNLNEMNMNADPAMDEIKLFRAKVKTDKWRLNWGNLRLGWGNVRLGWGNVRLGWGNVRLGWGNVRPGWGNVRLGWDNVRLGWAFFPGDEGVEG
ncbi:Cerebral peptide 1 [Folsomia candida]|uniref:Cerebral peptide 1 n=1 Tax=Folsomia candida TaxID=158441 RepID=A0A226DTC1_FOLCA|nr:Cerebral peptide 1 [Folsomia candida]